MTEYNASKHCSIPMAPRDVNPDVEHEVWSKQEAKGPQKVTGREPKT